MLIFWLFEDLFFFLFFFFFVWCTCSVLDRGCWAWACVLRANEDGSAVETGFLHRWMWFSLILRREVSVLSLLTGRDETSLTGERQSLVFLLQKGLACAHLFGFSRFLFFFFFFSLFGERAVFVLDRGCWGLGFCVAGERRMCAGDGFLLQNNVVLSVVMRFRLFLFGQEETKPRGQEDETKPRASSAEGLALRFFGHGFSRFVFCLLFFSGFSFLFCFSFFFAVCLVEWFFGS